MDILPEILKRKSIRQFSDRPVSKEQIERILEAGRLAPSAKNRQTWRFIAIQDPVTKRKIEKAAFGQEHVGQAQVIIASCTTNIDYRMPNGQLSYPVDVSIATAFMMFQATHENLGSCIVTTFDEQEIKALLSVPYSMRIVMLLLLGYSAKEPEKAPRLPIARVSSYEHW